MNVEYALGLIEEARFAVERSERALEAAGFRSAAKHLYGARLRISEARSELDVGSERQSEAGSPANGLRSR